MSDLFPNIDRGTRQRIVALQAEVAVLSAAVESYLAGTASTVCFVYSQVRTLAMAARDILSILTAAHDTTLVGGIQSLRETQRWLQRVYASPEIFGQAFEVEAADLAARGGLSNLSGLVLRRLKRYMVCDGDTPQSVAQVQLGDAARWQEITLLNRLTYPYFTDDPSYQAVARATGMARFSHVSAQAEDYTIPAGTQISTLATDDRPAVVFETTEAITIPAGDLHAEVSIQSLEPGLVGNVGPGEIAMIVSINAAKVEYDYLVSVSGADVAGNVTTVERAFRHEAFPIVSNAEATSGGQAGNVARSGTWIVLPVEVDAPRTPDILQFENHPSVQARQYGVDWWLSENGEIERDATGDARAVAGLENLSIAVWCACQIERGDLTFHPEYGSDLKALVGVLDRPSLPDEAMLAVRRAVVPDPRVRSAVGTVTKTSVGRLEMTVAYETEELFEPGVINLVVRATA